MPINVEIMPSAWVMLDRADERWSAEHGSFAANPLLDEVLRASDLLRANPQLGSRFRRRRPEVRRFLLSSGWYLYYRYHPERERVEIVAVWHASRRTHPRL